MDKVINLGIPHIGEQIFASIDTHHVVQFLQVSKTWRVIAEKVLNTKDRHGRNAFYLACNNGNDHHVQLMLENSDNIDVDSKDNLGQTPFYRACRCGQASIVSILLDHADTKQIDLNAKENDWSISPFAVACYFGHKDVAKSLLDYTGKTSIDFNAIDKKEKTSFNRAYESGSTELVKMLLLDYAVEKKLDLGLNHTLSLICKLPQTIRDLLHRPRLCLIDGHWRLNFKVAASGRNILGNSNEGPVKLLLEFSEKRDTANHSDNVRTALIQACKFEQRNIVNVILTHAEEKNIQIDYKTLLDVAMKNDMHLSQGVKDMLAVLAENQPSSKRRKTSDNIQK